MYFLNFYLYYLTILDYFFIISYISKICKNVCYFNVNKFIILILAIIFFGLLLKKSQVIEKYRKNNFVEMYNEIKIFKHKIHMIHFNSNPQDSVS